jgi:hypothetical protein
VQRQFADDRLLARLYLVDDGWIVQGATALLAREIGVRGTKDCLEMRIRVLDRARARHRGRSGLAETIAR